MEPKTSSEIESRYHSCWWEGSTAHGCLPTWFGEHFWSDTAQSSPGKPLWQVPLVSAIPTSPGMVRPGLPQPQRRPPCHWEQLIAQWANWDRANETYGCHWFVYIAWPSAWSKHDWYYHLTTTPCHPTNHEFKTCCQAPSWHRRHRSRGSQGCTDDPQKLFKPQQLL